MTLVRGGAFQPAGPAVSWGLGRTLLAAPRLTPLRSRPDPRDVSDAGNGAPFGSRILPQAMGGRGCPDPCRVCMVLAFASCWYAQPVEQSLLRGISIALVGLAIRAWAAGHLRKNESLTVSGPYAFVRTPLYIGSLLAGVGSGIATNQPVLLVTVISVFLLWFLPVVGEEEDHIRKILPGYSEYEARVPRFLPALVPGYASSERFDARLYMRNREYSALGGLLVFATILWIKL